MANTPNTWGVYMIGLVCDWLKEQGGVAAMQVRNEEKAAADFTTRSMRVTVSMAAMPIGIAGRL